jgi:hypothetical protein
MGFSNLIALLIIISCAATLHRNGITDIAESRVKDPEVGV